MEEQLPTVAEEEEGRFGFPKEKQQYYFERVPFAGVGLAAADDPSSSSSVEPLEQVVVAVVVPSSSEVDPLPFAVESANVANSDS